MKRYNPRTRMLTTVEQEIDAFIASSPLNVVTDLAEEMRIYDAALVGVASAEDPLWEKLKEKAVVGPQHLSPAEWMPEAKSVISYFLPFTERVRMANRGEGLPATEWLYGRIEGESCNNAVRQHVVSVIQSLGGRALAPALDSRFAAVYKDPDPEENFRSNWSERHVAFIAGLGTFGLSRSLITSLGTAGRFGSVIVDFSLEPTPRAYTEVDEYCTHCGACVRRCPAGAISVAGKEHLPCARFLQKTLAIYKPRYGCGKCQTGVPCESQKPEPAISR